VVKVASAIAVSLISPRLSAVETTNPRRQLACQLPSATRCDPANWRTAD
jgi:hypothetical protein